MIPTIELSRLLFVRIHPLQCLCHGLFCHPEELGAAVSSFTAAVLLTTVRQGQLVGREAFHLDSRMMACVLRPSLPQPPSRAPKGVQPICDSKGRAHLERRLRSGGTLLPRGSPAQYVPKHWEWQPPSHFYPHSSQPTTREECAPRL